MLVINDDRFCKRAEVIWEKGTNRAEFYRGEVNKYGWIDIGSSFLPSEVTAAFLYAQLEKLDEIQCKRKILWDRYYEHLNQDKQTQVLLPALPDYASNNAHLFYIICNDLKQRTDLISLLGNNEILSVFHYLSLHTSPYYKNKHDGRVLPESDRYSNCLMRLPIYYELENSEVDKICNILIS